MSKDVVSLAIMSRNTLFWSYFLPVEIVPLIMKKAHKTWGADETYRIKLTHEFLAFAGLLRKAANNSRRETIQWSCLNIGNQHQ